MSEWKSERRLVLHPRQMEDKALVNAARETFPDTEIVENTALPAPKEALGDTD